MKNLLFLLLLSGFASCSMSSAPEQKSISTVASEDSSNETLQLNEDDEVIVLDQELQSEIKATENNQIIVEEDSIFHDEDSYKKINREIASVEKELYEIEYGSYQVQKGDTLMLIAFKIYGDVSKWRSISVLNEEQLINEDIEVDMNLRYEIPEDKFVWKPMGTPYIVKEDDSLSIISGTVYDSTKHWQYIWDNNRPLVKNPNLIFAGFTLYYLPIDEKEKYEKVLEARYKRMEESLKLVEIKKEEGLSLSKLTSIPEVI